MKKTTFCLIALLISSLFPSIKAQTSIAHTHSHGVIDRNTRIEIQESFYRGLANNPLIDEKDVALIRFFFIENIEVYKKMVHDFESSTPNVTVDGIKNYMTQVENVLIADFNKAQRFKILQNKFVLPASGNMETEKGPNDKIPNGPCSNMGFENCDFTDWVLTQGYVDANPYGFITPTPTTNWGNGAVAGFPSGSGGDQHYIVNAGIDPNAPIQMVNPLNGGTCTALIGDGNSVSSHASKISQTFLVDASNAGFSYSYAAVLEDPSGHTLGEKPYFSANVFDSNGTPIACGSFQSTAGDGSPGWINTGAIQYRDWSTVIVPLQAYIGQNVTVEFTVGDCSQSGHFGYAYIEASCEPLEIVPSDTVVCGDPVVLQAPSPFNGTYLWSTGATTSSITTSTPGLYTVDLITAPGCFITLEVIIVSDSTAPTAIFAADTVCQGTLTSFTDLSTTPTGIISNWNWDFDNDGVVDNLTQNPTYTFPALGTYPVNLSVGGGSCAHDTTIDVIVSALPIADFTFTNECFGSAIGFTDLSNGNGGVITTWNWDFDNNGVVDNTSQSPTNGYLAAGSYAVELYVSAGGACADSITKQVQVWPMPIVNFTPTEVCLNDTTQFNDLSTVSTSSTPNGIVQWNWSFNELGGSTVQHPTFIFNNEGVIPTTLIVTTNNGCVDSVTIDVTVNPLPVVMFGSDTAACAPVCVTLDNSSSISSGFIASYQWDLGDGSGVSGQNPTYCFQNQSRVATRTYDISLTAISNEGCRTSLTIPNMITVYPIPLADFIVEPEITDVYDREVSFYDQSEIASTWWWDLGDGSNSITNNPVHEYADSGSYIVSLYIENIFGCKDTVRREIRIRPAYAIWIPNTFTPDGDGINEGFFIDGFGLQEVELRIYDRWGLQLFHETGWNESVVWNGEYKGSLVKDDVYVYKARVKDIFDKYHDFVGKVTILK